MTRDTRSSDAGPRSRRAPANGARPAAAPAGSRPARTAGRRPDGGAAPPGRTRTEAASGRSDRGIRRVDGDRRRGPSRATAQAGPGMGRPGGPARRPGGGPGPRGGASRPRPRPVGGSTGGRPPVRGGGGGGGRGGRGPGGRGPGDGPGSGGRSFFGRDRAGGRKRSIVWRWRRPIFLIGLAMLALMAGVGVVMAQTELPDIQDLEQSSYVCASDVAENECKADTAMMRFQSDENRTLVPLDEVPEVVVQAVIAMEDRNFFEHDGVNPMGIARAMFQNVKGGGVSQGGSTITQQFVKNAFKLSTERAFSRKIKEAVLSIKLEQQMSKEEILEGYLNTIFFGRGAYGIGAASQAYFGIDVRDITDPGQAALLAGIIRAPALAEPSKHPEEAARRRRTALVAMEEEGYITQEQVELADAQPIAEPWVKLGDTSVKLTETLKGGGDHEDYMGTDYLDVFIRSELNRIDPERFTDEVINGGGLRIYTSINYDAQRAAWNAVTSTLDQEDDPNTPEWDGDPEAAMVAVDDRGLIQAMVGSRHRYTPDLYWTNYATRRREVGSTYKPLVLAEAIVEGYSLESRYNAQGTMEFEEWPDQEGNPWRVSNYSESDAGVLDLVAATAESSNTAFAQLMLDLGIEPVDADGDGTARAAEGANKVAELGRKMGLGGADGIDETQRVPSSVLGSAEASPLEMAGVYSTFANNGVYRRPEIITRVEQVDQSGNITLLYQWQQRDQPVLSQTQAALVTHALQSVVAPGGTGAGANFGKPAAGKTGTSQNNRNAWFAGYVPKLTAVVWMGHPKADFLNPDTGKHELWPMNESGMPVHGRAATGGSFPATIWKKFMEQVAANLDGEFPAVTPEQIANGTILNEDMLTPEESATSIPEGGPPWSIPDFTIPGGGGGRPGRTSTSIDPDSTTSTTDSTGTTDTTEGPGFPGLPNNNNG